MEEPISLPARVEELIAGICRDQQKPPISRETRKLLASIEEEAAVKILTTISSVSIKKTFDGFVRHLVMEQNRRAEPAAVCSPHQSPMKRPLPVPPSSGSSPFASPQKKYCDSKQSPVGGFQKNFSPSDLHRTGPQQIIRQPSFEEDTQESVVPIVRKQISFSSEPIDKTNSSTISPPLRILSVLEFRKLFLVLTYLGKEKLESVISPNFANHIVSKKDCQMEDFESEMWSTLGYKYCRLVDRSQYFDWTSGKTYLYYCYVGEDGSYQFKGPYLDSTRTHMQRSLGDDNVLIVKLLSDKNDCVSKPGNEGILVGLWRYRHIGYKDDRQKVKKKEMEKEKKSGYFAKVNFARFECLDPCMEDKSYILYGKSPSEARRLFMHIHTVPSLEKYTARFSLIMSKTIKLPVDLSGVRIIEIDDIPFRDENGSPIKDEDGNILVHTDGTGYISEDLAMKCPEDFSAAKYIKDNRYEESAEETSTHKRGARAQSNNPPLLIQCRLFHNGCAVKGTLLVNKKLEPGTIQIRPSMIKVRADKQLPEAKTFNSLEIVSVSHRPGRTSLAKHLIMLLSYGGAPQKFFLDLLTNALEDTRNVYYNRRAALRIAANNDSFKFAYIAEIMLSCGIPLNEPFLQHCLSNLEKNGKSKLKKGKIPIGDTFYLMGTADPTGTLNNDEVCVILDNGQISGDVLVYRNPGLHFGDIHAMKAVYKKEIEEVVGNSKYGVFFSTKGKSSAAYEMATGDFDGDMYWVSRNSELLKDFRASKPWSPPDPTPSNGVSNGSNSSREVPKSENELEIQLYRLCLESNKPRFEMATATRSWTSYMDRWLTLGNNRASEKDELEKKMTDVLNFYYDELDAPKSGKKGKLKSELVAEDYPHYMEMGDHTFNSSSILGQIYDTVAKFQSESKPEQDIWKLPCFDVPSPEPQEYVECLNMWRDRYAEYRKCMTDAMNSGHESKNDNANDVVKKYKKLLYDADDMENTRKDTERIYLEALAIYHVNYDYAISCSIKDRVKKCNFAWRIAGSALCNIYTWKTAGPYERPLLILPSVIREVLNCN